MGKRKNRHCQSKQEVLQRVWEKKRGQQEHLAKRQLRTINQVRPAIERANFNPHSREGSDRNFIQKLQTFLFHLHNYRT